MSYPYRNPAGPPAGFTPYPGGNYPSQGNPPYPGADGGYAQQGGQPPYPSSNYPQPFPGSPYPPQGNSPYPNLPYAVNPPSSGYNPTMGATPYLPAGYPTFQPVPSSYPPAQNTDYSSSNVPVGNLYPGTSPYPSGSSAYPTASYGGPSASPTPYQNTSQTTPYPSSAAQTSPYPSSASQTNPYPSSATQTSPYPSSTSQTSPYPSSVSQPTSRMANYEGQGTVVPYPGFDPNTDAQTLRKAMKGFGTDEKAIINVLAHRTNAQRVYIAVAFKQMYGKDLIDDLKSELSGKFEDVIVALMTPLNDYLAREVHRAMSGIGTDEDALIEILCTRTNQEIWQINEAYNRLYGKSLEDAIKGDTSGYFRRLLVSSCMGARSEAPADPATAVQDAHALFEAGVGQWGTDESAFNAILCSKSFHHLSLVFYEYQKLSGHSVVDAIKTEMSGDLKAGMLAIARSVENRPGYFAEKIYRAMKGAGTDDKTLIRIVASRCEIDMVQIRAEYERTYGKPLADAIADDTSGDYKRVLVALVNG